jgi:trans-aconitate methyltransferase
MSHATPTDSMAYYTTAYRHYEKQNPAYKYAHYLKTIHHYQPNFNDLLDFGCATGRFLSYLQAAMPTLQLFGTDINTAALQQAERTLPQATFKPGGVEALQHLPLVEVITAFDVLEHVPDPEQALHFFNKTLQTGGILIAVMPVYDGSLGWLVHLLDKDPTHLHKYSREYWQQRISRHFDILDWHGIFRFLFPGGWYFHKPTRLLKYAAPAILIIARKANRP